jgi:hypothetical protein
MAKIAFTEIVESINARELPRTGGCGATVVVTMTLQQLLADLDEAGVCTLDTGGRISAGEARRLACRADIIPMVLGGKSQILDVGQKCRFHMRTPYSEGGGTSVEDGRLLCPHHHGRIHDPRFRATRLPNGKIRFHRRE